LDYKTDRVREFSDPEGELIRRYQIQLDYYEQALRGAVNKPVKERYLYSFSLEKEVKI
jgi:ATP-dependent helicase/nuclease subunit A